MTWSLQKFMPTHIIFHDGLSLKLTSMISLPGTVKLAYIIHAAEQLCFGPYAVVLSGGVFSNGECQLLYDVDGIWSVSRAIQEYVTKYGGLRTTLMYNHLWNYLEPGSQ